MTRDLTEFEKEVQNHITDILRDIIEDNKKIIKRMQATIILLVILLAGVFVYSEYSFRKFLAQYDFSSTSTSVIETEANDSNHTINNGNINVKK